MNRIDEIKEELKYFELNEDDYREDYEEMLDDFYGEIDICGLSYRASYALKEADPIAYEQGLSDYVNSLDISEDERYLGLEAELKELEDQA